VTIKNVAEIARLSVDLVQSDFQKLDLVSDPALRAGLLVQPLPVTLLQSSRNRGADLLGLANEHAPLLRKSTALSIYNKSLEYIVLSMELRHSTPANDDGYEAFITRARKTIEQQALLLGVNHTFRYLNYASGDQDPYQVFRRNETEMTWVKGVYERYDPQMFVKTYVSQPFKI